MSRIRSVHPGLATDEAYMAMSITAKAAWPLLWTECDDNGAFEWKPLVLKARLFPADNINFAEILSELERLDCIKSYEHNGRIYALVRNFTKFQRPKKPQSRHFIPAELRTYAGLSELSTEPVPHQADTGGIKSPQMEDGEGEEEGERKKDKTAGAAATAKKYAFEGGVVKLSDKHFTDWTAAYPNLDLRGELIARDAWLAGPKASDEDRRNWFISTSKYLANRNLDSKTKIAAATPKQAATGGWA